MDNDANGKVPDLAETLRDVTHDALEAMGGTGRRGRIRGTAIELADGVTYVIPPLRLFDFVERKDELVAIGGTDLGPSGGDEAVRQLRILAELVALCLERNYPELADPQKVLRLVDFGCLNDVLGAMIAQNGLVRPGEVPAPTGATT